MLAVYGARITYEESEIWTVFPQGIDENKMPQDFNSYTEAEAYAKENFSDYQIISPNN